MPFARHPLLFASAAIAALVACSSSSSPTSTPSHPTIGAPTIWLQHSSSIDPTALPLRDQAYVTDAPKQGHVFVCDAKAYQQVGGPGALKVGGWVDTAAGTYDVTKKIFVRGNDWYDDAQFTLTPT